MKENESAVQNTRDPTRTYLQYRSVEVQGECILLEICPVHFNRWKFALFIFLNVIAFIPLLLITWYPWLKRVFYYDFCTYEEADHFYILNYDQQADVVERLQKNIYTTEDNQATYIYFVNRYMTYIIDETLTVRVSMFDSRKRIAKIMGGTQKIHGLNTEQAHGLLQTYGPGTMEIHQPSCLLLFVKEVVRPLYLFVFFSVFYWYFQQGYTNYAYCIFFISLAGLFLNLYQMNSLNTKIFHMAYYEVPVNILRNGSVEQVSSFDVVPGDIVFLKESIKIPFEGMILEGSAIINQCALTGESVPVVKKADTLDILRKENQNIDKSALVFEGTTIVQVNYKKKMTVFEQFRQKYGVPVCVMRTNFITMKGQLIRIILFPKEGENSFTRESTKFLFFLFGLGVITYCILIILIYPYVTGEDLGFKFLDMLTIIIPPALPVSMTFGIIYALEKLNKKLIFCIEQNKIIDGGLIQFCCFDKTGTLTEDYMDFHCLVPSSGAKFTRQIRNTPNGREETMRDLDKNNYLKDSLNNMASNHSIIKILDTGLLVGDPMEIKLFDFGLFQFHQQTKDPDAIFSFKSQRGHQGEIFKRFEFDSDVQRMSVISKNSYEAGFMVYTKGSPQMMLTIMDKSSIPADYHQILRGYASHGFRVLAIASQKLKSDYKIISRGEAENGLIFNGFEVFENKLKPQTKLAIQQLQEAQIGCVMITGDNTLTGSNISYKCNISDKSKRMIICDSVDGVYTEEDFSYEGQQGEFIESNPVFDRQKSMAKLIDMNKQEEIQKLPIEELYQVEREDIGVAFMKKIIFKANEGNAQLCITGKVFNNLFPGDISDLTQLQRKILSITSVFARTKPNDKAKIVMAYQYTGMKVSMCGDGANDCGALKQANIGLSLSQAEASISAPFTSQITNISSMVELIKQCRAGLATNFTLFNVMASYALIQYTSTIISEKFLAYPSDFNFLFWDLGLNFFFVLFIGYTGTVDRLSIERPSASLFCLTNLLQILVMFIVQLLGQILMIVAYSNAFNFNNYYFTFGGMDVNFQRYNEHEDFIQDTPETNVIFLFTNIIYIATVIQFNIAKPWRKYYFTNIPLIFITIVQLTYCSLIILVPKVAWDRFYLTSLVNQDLRWFLFGMTYLFGLFLIINQKLIMEPLSFWLRSKYPHAKWL